MRTSSIAALVFATSALALPLGACTNSDAPNPNPGVVNSPSALNPQVSACGGFSAVDRGTDEYCAAEKLHWAFDATTSTLALQDLRVMLNCCGDHSVSVSYDEQSKVLRVLETDAPQDGSKRCKCSCVFDFAVDVGKVPEGVTSIALVRHVTDQGEPQTIWTGTLDLASKAGDVIVDANPLDYPCKTSP